MPALRTTPPNPASLHTPIGEVLDIYEHLVGTTRLAADLTRLDTALEAAVHNALAAYPTLGQAQAALPSMLQTLTGVTALTRFKGPKEADTVHSTRNLLAAPLAGALLALDDDPSWLLTRLPTLMPRGSHGRALRDDEVLLIRLVGNHACTLGGRHWKAAIGLSIIDAGAAISEAAAVTAHDITPIDRPETVTVPGVHRQTSRRTLPLSAWSQNLLTQALEALHRERDELIPTPLAFHGSGENANSASASMSGTIARRYAAAGLTDPSISAGAYPKWRLHDVHQRAGLEAAQKVLGSRSADAVLRRLQSKNSVTTPAATPGGFTTSGL